MKYLFFAVLSLLPMALLGQTGNFFLSHYSPASERFDNVCFDMVQDTRGVLYFATNDGIVEFDGMHWELIQAKGAIYSLLITTSGDIYWTGSTGFGRIIKDEGGKDSIGVMSQAPDVFQSISTESHLYFISDESAFVVETATGKSLPINTSNLTGSFTGIFELYNSACVTTEKGGVFRISNGKLEHIDFALPEGVDIISSAREDDKYMLLASNNRIFQCDSRLALREITLQDQAYADASVVVSVTWVNNQLIALGTLRGGVLFVNANNGRTQEIVNYATGLPDNEVFAIMTDNNQSVWVAHDYGFSRISPYLPFRSFSHYPGLRGNILCAFTFRNNVYAGTSLGLFKLIKEDIYDELVSFVDIEIKYKNSSGKQAPAIVEVKIPVTEKTQEPESKKGGFFRFLRRKKEDKKPVTKEETKPQDKKSLQPLKETAVPSRPKFRREKRIEKVLRSSQYAFHRVKDIDAKVTQLIEFNGTLIAAGLGGVYEISDLQANAIIMDPVRYIFGYKSHNLLLASTYEDELRAISHTNGQWEAADIFKDLDDQINFIFEGKGNELWLASLEKMYRLELDDSKVKNIQTVALSNDNLEKTVGMIWKDNVILTNANGFFYFNREKNAIARIDSLQKPRSYFATGGNLWYRDSHRWNMLGAVTGQSNLQLLNLFNDLRVINADQTSDNLWLVSRDNELFRFYGEKITPYERGFPVYVKSIVSGEQPMRISGQLEVGENNGLLSFTMVQPDYSGLEATEYRYILKGLHTDWSDWSNSNNTVDFPYLPPGKYSLLVQSKNVVGKISDMKPVFFDVLPPYWKRSWFYALEFFVFAGLVVISYRLSTRYRFISRLLMLITIILLIEFIQTVAGATFASKDSPVTDFFIQVGVALVILPVESYLRNLMLRSIGSPDIHPILGKRDRGS